MYMAQKSEKAFGSVAACYCSRSHVEGHFCSESEFLSGVAVNAPSPQVHPQNDDSKIKRKTMQESTHTMATPMPRGRVEFDACKAFKLGCLPLESCCTKCCRKRLMSQDLWC